VGYQIFTNEIRVFDNPILEVVSVHLQINTGARERGELHQREFCKCVSVGRFDVRQRILPALDVHITFSLDQPEH
jgi:hypothetical protein